MLRTVYVAGFASLCLAEHVEEQLLGVDDDCAPGEEAQCSLSALQLQGTQLSAEEEGDLDLRKQDHHPTSDGCFETGRYYYPNKHHKSVESSALPCQMRCINTPGCAHFSYWPDGGCHLQEASAKKHRAHGKYHHVVSGPPECPGTSHHAVAVATTSHNGGSAACSAVPGCARLKINGDCCPTPTGMFLGCCPDSVVPHPTAPPPIVQNGRKLMTVYHQTSPEACKGILAEGFRLGHGGWCGDAIYFALTPQATKTKAITPHSGIGCMLEAVVDIGNKQKFPCCRLCGGAKDEHVYWTEQSLKAKGYDSIEINPGDGPEIIIYNNNRIVSIKAIPFNKDWTPHLMHYSE